jgi:Tol biopolymer transport system component
MDHRSVERSFRLRPSVPGSFNWVGNELVFLPTKRLAYSTTYRLRVDGKAVGAGGRDLLRPYQTSFTTQAQHLLYLGSSGDEKGHLVLASISGAKKTVDGGSGNVEDFSVSLDRTLAVFVKRGSSTERQDEIWMLSLADGSSQRVYRRPDWNIKEPHLSPDGNTIVFLATNVRICTKYYRCFRDQTSPIVEILDLRTHRVRQFHSAGDVPITNFVDFSPAGQLAYTDLGSPLTLSNIDGSNTLHIPNGNNELVYAGFDPTGARAAFVGQTPSSSGGDILVYDRGRYIDISKGVYDSTTPSFSSSGKALAYAGYRGELGIEPIYGVTTYSFVTGTTRKLTSEKRFSDWAPQWSPDDRYIALIRSQPQEAMYMGEGEIWVIGSDGKDPRPLGATASEVRWVI